jgi:hypothetical protein
MTAEDLIKAIRAHKITQVMVDSEIVDRLGKLIPSQYSADKFVEVLQKVNPGVDLQVTLELSKWVEGFAVIRLTKDRRKR